MSGTPFQNWHKDNHKQIQEEKKKAVSVKPWDLLDKSKYGETELANKRFDICLSCPELIKSTHQCKKCGCFMKLKTKLNDATCPLGKW